MKTYYLCRNEDVSSTSGTGRIAEVAEFDDGAVVVRWIGDMNATGVTSTTVFHSLADMLKVHGHQGRTVLEKDLDHDRLRALEERLRETDQRLQEALSLLQSHGVEFR
jgi:uncharacterized protein with GYD domain